MKLVFKERAVKFNWSISSDVLINFMKLICPSLCTICTFRRKTIIMTRKGRAKWGLDREKVSGIK